MYGHIGLFRAAMKPGQNAKSEQERILEGGGTVFLFDGLRIAHIIVELCAVIWMSAHKIPTMKAICRPSYKNTVLPTIHIPSSTSKSKNRKTNF